MSDQIHATEMERVKQCNQVALESGQRIGSRPVASTVPAKIGGDDEEAELDERSSGLVPRLGLAGQRVDKDNR